MTMKEAIKTENRTQVVPVRVPIRYYEELRRIAHAQEGTIMQQIRIAIRNYLQHNNSQPRLFLPNQEEAITGGCQRA